MNDQQGSTSNTVQITSIAIGLLAGCFMLFWYLSPAPATAAKTTTTVEPTAMLRFAGSNTIGSELLPALAEAYMKQQGVSEVKRIKGKAPDEISLVDATNPSLSTTIEIAAHGSGTAFRDLSEAKADIGMSSRRINASELTKLALMGDMTAPSKEHVLALDGIAIIVNRSNSISALTKDQIAAIFAGVITDWAELKRNPGKIKLYARDSKSGTYDTFKSVVLDNLKLSEEAKRFEDSVMLSDQVAADPNGIGFVGLPFVKDARALAISDTGTAPLLANRLTVATEDYPLSRRLYLYTPDKRDNQHVRKFTEFAMSHAGQEIVKRNGFIELSVQSNKVVTQSEAPEDYVRLTAGAERLSLNFRFLPGSPRIDNKGVRDMDRMIEFVESAKAANKSIMLFGFSDSTGDATINQNLSRDRAKAVAEELTRRGIKLAQVTGYGASLPVASNQSREGREKNRRVEVWVRN
jgi:phosphate transport system substrate-binding protein